MCVLLYHLCHRFRACRGGARFPGEFGVLVHPLLRHFVVMSGGHCTFPTGGPTIRIKNKKTDEAQKAATVTVCSYICIIYIYIYSALMRRPNQYFLQLDIALWCKNQIEHSICDESLLFCICACSLEYSSESVLRSGSRFSFCFLFYLW